MPSTSTMALIDHGLNGDSLKDHVVGAHYPKPANPPGAAHNDRLVHSDSTLVASANANAHTSNAGDGDDITQSGANDVSSGSSDGTDPETEALERVMKRYVPRTRPSKPAVGAKPSNLPSARTKPINNVPQPSSTKSGRTPAVTATTKTTAPRPKK